MVALVRDLGRRHPAGWAAAAVLGRILAVVAALAVITGAALFADRSVLHFWHEIRPIYHDHSINSRLDFTWFFYGMQTAWQHADPAHRLYSVAAQDQWMQRQHWPYDHSDLFGYPPPFALLWSPLAALPYVAARQLWTQINIAALGLGLVVAAWHASPRFGLARWLLLAGMGLWASPLTGNFYWGQPNAITLVLVALGLAGVMRPGRTAHRPVADPPPDALPVARPLPVTRPRPATSPPGPQSLGADAWWSWPAALGGVALGLGAVFKLTPLFILAYLPLRWLLDFRGARGRAAGVGALTGWATVALTCAAAGLVLGWPTLTTYVHQTIPAVERSAWMHGAAPWNQSFRGILMVWHHPDRWLTHASDLFAVGVFALTVAVVALRPDLDYRLEAALAALLVLLCSPSLEDHHFTVAVLPWILVAGYLLDRLADWRKWWLLPLVFTFIGASVALVAPNRLHWPPVVFGGSVSVPVPPGNYDRVYMLGAASYGPVAFTLRLQYRGAATGSAAAHWPDWWSPDNPLHPVLSGIAENAGKVSNGHVGLYGFSYPVRPEDTLTGLGLPSKLPQQNGGPEALHVVAVTLGKAGGGFVQVPLAYNARGIASAANTRARQDGTFDGNGSLFWSGVWRRGLQGFTVSGARVPFAMPSAAAANVLNVPPTATSPAPGGPRWLQVVLGKAPSFTAIALLFVTAWVAAAAESGPARDSKKASAWGH